MPDPNTVQIILNIMIQKLKKIIRTYYLNNILIYIFMCFIYEICRRSKLLYMVYEILLFF